MIDLDKLQALCDAATPGEWGTFYGGEPLCIGGEAGQVADVTFLEAMGQTFKQAQHDAAFIAASRQALPELIAEVRRLRETAAKWDRVRGTDQLIIENEMRYEREHDDG